MTNLNRIATQGHSAASVMAAALGLDGKPADPSHPIYRMLQRMHKQEVLAVCEDYSHRKGLRLEHRILP